MNTKMCATGSWIVQPNRGAPDKHSIMGCFITYRRPDEFISLNSVLFRVLWNAVLCRYNAVAFLQNNHKRHPIACPLGRCMWCLLWFWYVIHLHYWYRSVVCNIMRPRYNGTWMYRKCNVVDGQRFLMRFIIVKSADNGTSKVFFMKTCTLFYFLHNMAGHWER